MHKETLLVALCLLLMVAVGCTPKEEKQVREAIEQHRGEIDSEVQKTVKKANCQAFNGYICSAPDDCGVPYLDTIESYCCPIACGTCNNSCDDNDHCTKDYCSKATGYECKHDITYPCPNNGICEFQESHLNVNGNTSFGGKNILLRNVGNDDQNHVHIDGVPETVASTPITENAVQVDDRVLVDIDGITETVTSTPKMVNGVQVEVKETFYSADKTQRSATLLIGENIESDPADCA